MSSVLDCESAYLACYSLHYCVRRKPVSKDILRLEEYDLDILLQETHATLKP